MNCKGTTLLEYTLIAVLIILIAIAGIRSCSDAVSALWQNTSNTVATALND